MIWILYVLAGLIFVFLVVFVVVSFKKRKKEELTLGSKGVLKNKKFIENMVANVESILTYANGNDELCNKLVKIKDDIRFFNPTANAKVGGIDAKIANRLDDLKIMVASDNTQETCLRVVEEIEAFIVTRKKEEL